MDTFDGACHTFRHARVNVLLDLGQLVFQVVSSLLIVPASINLVKEKQNIVQSYEILITSLFTSLECIIIKFQFHTKQTKK